MANKIQIMEQIQNEMENVAEWLERTAARLRTGEPAIYSALITVEHIAKLDAWKAKLNDLDDAPDVFWEFLYKRGQLKAIETLKQEKDEK